MEVLEADIVEIHPVAASAQDDLGSDGDEVLLAADGDVVVVRTDESCVDGKVLGHVVRDFCYTPDSMRGAVDIHEAVIADGDDLLWTDAEIETRVLTSDTIFEDLYGSISESSGLSPQDFGFGRRPEEATNHTTEDTSGCNALLGIRSAVVALVVVPLGLEELPVLLMLKVGEFAGERVNVLPLPFAIGTDKSLCDVVAHKVWQGVPIII